MSESASRLFVGIKITKALQADLDSPPPGMQHYFDGNNKDFLEIVNLREDRIIGRYLADGFPVANLADVTRNVRSIVSLITRGHRIDEDAVHIYSC
ncbi:MAG: hypothetical protein EXR70_08555 [Deltaproteobacteria bacterium]|nr:hypothetical protein [Deltaproteobacteria bacterium]